MQDDIQVQSTGSETSVRSGNQAWLLPASILVAALLISGSIVYLVHSGKGATPNPPVAGDDIDPPVTAEAPKLSDRDVVLGDPNAPVALIEYGDYQCPFCAQFFTGIEPTLRSQYIQTGKVKMVFRNLVFVDRLSPQTFDESHKAAEAAECAKDQQKFWEYHDAIYAAEAKDEVENNGNLNRDFFMKTAADLKLDTKAFASCIDSGKYADKPEADNADAAQYGVNSTPTVFINDTKLTGLLPLAQYRSAIDAALSAAQ